MAYRTLSMGTVKTSTGCPSRSGMEASSVDAIVINIDQAHGTFKHQPSERALGDLQSPRTISRELWGEKIIQKFDFTAMCYGKNNRRLSGSHTTQHRLETHDLEQSTIVEPAFIAAWLACYLWPLAAARAAVCGV